MGLRDDLQRFRKEHDAILRFLRDWESALQLTDSDSADLRRQGLGQLLAMDAKLQEIRDHCEEEEQHVESPFQLYLEDEALEHLRKEHELLDRLTAGFRSTMRMLTAPPETKGLVGLGQRLLAQLRHHIAFEEGLLKQIEDGSEADERILLHNTHPVE